MRIKIVLLTTLILALGLTGFAQSKTTSGASGADHSRSHTSPQSQTIQALAKAVADAFYDRKLGSLDAGRPYVGPVRIRIEYNVDVENKSFKTLEAAEQWLRSKETKDGEMTVPRRDAGALQKCQKGGCAFEPAGGVHGVLWLKQITYGMSKGKPYIKVMHLVAD
jgi:hypothetical protein